jgi:pimeloyl-ACP methyl ester carboxylesterase
MNDRHVLIKSFFLSFYFILVGWVALPAHAQNAPLDFWGSLPKGIYQTGYQRAVEVDTTRKNLQSALPKNRPIVMNIWYPTHDQGQPMLHKEYINFDYEPLSEKLQKNFIEYNLEMIKTYSFNADRKTLKRGKLLKDMLATPTHAIKNAAFIDTDQKFPLIVFHQGLGASIEDNAAMNEWLASHGFVVINASYQSNDPGYLHVDWDLDVSVPDINFMLDYVLSTFPQIDSEKIGIMGQSYGGQAALAYTVLGAHEVKGVITFDSTIDYSVDPDDPGFDELFKPLLRDPENVTMPILAFADQDATFAILDRLTASERFYVKTKGIFHEDYISQGAVGAMMETPYIRNKYQPNYEKRWQTYLQICQDTLDFWRAVFTDNIESLSLSNPTTHQGANTPEMSYEQRALGENPWNQNMVPVSIDAFPQIEGSFTSKKADYKFFRKDQKLYIQFKDESKSKVLLFKKQSTQERIVWIDYYGFEGVVKINAEGQVQKIRFSDWWGKEKIMTRVFEE